MALQPTPLNRLSVMAGKKGLTDLHIPTITEDAQDVVGKLMCTTDVWPLLTR